MRNRYVGMIIVGISILVGFLVWLFNNALTKIVDDNCSHGPACPMWGSINFQTNVGLGCMVFIVIVGLYLIIFAKDDPQIVKEIHKETRIVKEQIKSKKLDKGHYKSVLQKLDADERSILEKILESNGSIFQSELVDNTKYTKVKVTRILDRLEGKGIIERKRRGMTNVVILKHI